LPGQRTVITVLSATLAVINRGTFFILIKGFFRYDTASPLLIRHIKQLM